MAPGLEKLPTTSFKFPDSERNGSGPSCELNIISGTSYDVCTGFWTEATSILA